MQRILHHRLLLVYAYTSDSPTGSTIGSFERASSSPGYAIFALIASNRTCDWLGFSAGCRCCAAICRTAAAFPLAVHTGCEGGRGWYGEPNTEGLATFRPESIGAAIGGYIDYAFGFLQTRRALRASASRSL